MEKKCVSPGFTWVDVIIYFIIAIAAIITAYPFIYIFSASISDPMEVVANSIWLFPKGFSLLSYKKVFENTYLWRSFFNSVFFTVTITALSSINSLLAGFALSKKDLFGKKFFVIYILIPMFFSGGLIPTFLVMVNLGLLNTIWSLIIPGVVNVWNIILVRTYISNLPISLQEAAILDGANDFKIAFSIIMPLSKSILAVISLYTAIAIWNNWFNAMIYLPGKPEWHPLQLYLTKVLIWGQTQGMVGTSGVLDAEAERQRMLNAAVGSQLKYTIIIVSSLPIMLVYPFLQKHFVKGALLGSLKE